MNENQKDTSNNQTSSVKSKKQELIEILETAHDVYQFLLAFNTAENEVPKAVATFHPLAANIAIAIEGGLMTSEDMMKMSKMLEKANKRYLDGLEEAKVVEDTQEGESVSEELKASESDTETEENK